MGERGQEAEEAEEAVNRFERSAATVMVRLLLWSVLGTAALCVVCMFGTFGNLPR